MGDGTNSERAGYLVKATIATCMMMCLTLAVGAPALAQYQELSVGNGFYAMCADAQQREGWQGAVCVAYVKGLADMALRPTGMVEAAVCMPKDTTYAKSMEILLAYLKDRPAERQKRTSQLLWDAWSAAFPCRSAEPSPRR